MRTKAAEPFSARSLAASASDRLLLRAAARPCAFAADRARRPPPGSAWRCRVDLRLFSEQFGDLAWHGGAIEELHGRRAVRLHPIPPPDQHGWRFCRRRRNLWARPFRLGRPRHNLTCRRHLPRRAAFFFQLAQPRLGPAPCGAARSSTRQRWSTMTPVGPGNFARGSAPAPPRAPRWRGYTVFDVSVRRSRRPGRYPRRKRRQGRTTWTGGVSCSGWSTARAPW